MHRATFAVGPITREIALKRLLPDVLDDEVIVQDFIREAKIATRLHHPNIVRVLELGSVDGTYFIAMELLRGAPLAVLLERSAELHVPVPLEITLPILLEVADALDYAQNGLDAEGQRFDLLHRDVTPSNIFVGVDGHIKIIDFGVAKARRGRFATQSGLAKGKLGYMSSEAIAAEELDARSDLFSLGVVTDDYLPPRSQAVRAPSLLVPECPRALDAIVLRALAPDRRDRWSTAAALARALAKVQADLPGPATAHEVAAWLDELVGRTLMHQRPRLPTAPTEWSPRGELATEETRTIDSRFDATPFDADDRSALGEASPFPWEPSEPSMELVVTLDNAPPPPNEFATDGVTRDGSLDTVDRGFPLEEPTVRGPRKPRR